MAENLKASNNRKGKEKRLEQEIVFSMILRRQLHIFCNHTHRGDLNVYGNPPQCKMTFIPQTVTCALFLPVSSATLMVIRCLMTGMINIVI